MTVRFFISGYVSLDESKCDWCLNDDEEKVISGQEYMALSYENKQNYMIADHEVELFKQGYFDSLEDVIKVDK